MFRNPKQSSAETPATHPGQQFDAPWRMTTAWARVAGMISAGVLALGLGVVATVYTGEFVALGAGAIIAAPALVFGGIMAWYTKRTEAMIYPGQQRGPVISDGPTVVFVRDRVRTKTGFVDKDAEPVDVGMPPRDAVRALRWMKANGKTSRTPVCAGANISQPAWAKLNRALQDFGILDGGGLTDEVDYLIAQLESHL